jgi:hypothetical protein
VLLASAFNKIGYLNPPNDGVSTWTSVTKFEPLKDLSIGPLDRCLGVDRRGSDDPAESALECFDRLKYLADLQMHGRSARAPEFVITAQPPDRFLNFGPAFGTKDRQDVIFQST